MHATTASLAMLTVLSAASGAAHGALIDGFYWADEVSEWAGPVQNYSGELMTEDTTWWLTGPPDSDVDGNGYAFDPVDNDYVAGWRECAGSGDESVTVHFEAPIGNRAGPDLMIYKYAGPNASASIWASADDVDYVQVGEMGGGTPGQFVEVWVDLEGLVDNAQYVRVIREATGPRTATFIDAFGVPLLYRVTPSSVESAGLLSPATDPIPTPEPPTGGVIGLGLLACINRRR